MSCNYIEYIQWKCRTSPLQINVPLSRRLFNSVTEQFGWYLLSVCSQSSGCCYPHHDRTHQQSCQQPWRCRRRNCSKKKAWSSGSVLKNREKKKKKKERERSKKREKEGQRERESGMRNEGRGRKSNRERERVNEQYVIDKEEKKEKERKERKVESWKREKEDNREKREWIREGKRKNRLKREKRKVYI